MTDESALPPDAAVSRSALIIALVGFMGAGKTTVGQALAARLGWRFADLDDLIEAQERRTIGQIFSEDGEPRFRHIESQALERAVDSGAGSMVLALGGGAFVDERSRELLRDRGIRAVWLDAPANELFRRCDVPEKVRPLRRELQQFCDLYERRTASYQRADLRIVTNSKEISSIVEEIIERLGLLPARRSSD